MATPMARTKSSDPGNSSPASSKRSALSQSAAPAAARRPRRARSAREEGQGRGGEVLGNFPETGVPPPVGNEQQAAPAMSLPAAMAGAGAAAMAAMAAPIVAVVGTAMAATAMATGLNAAVELSQNPPETSSTLDVDAASEDERPARKPDAGP